MKQGKIALSNISNQLKNLNLSKLKTKNGRSVESELRGHANILLDCIEYELKEAYMSYSPKVYQRSFGLYRSLFVGDMQIKIGTNGLNLSVQIGFDDSAMHDNFFGKPMNTAILMNEGWKTHGNFADVPYLGYREGTHFIEKGVLRYKKSVKQPFPIVLKINNEIRNF